MDALLSLTFLYTFCNLINDLNRNENLQSLIHFSIKSVVNYSMQFYFVQSCVIGRSMVGSEVEFYLGIKCSTGFLGKKV